MNLTPLSNLPTASVDSMDSCSPKVNANPSFISFGKVKKGSSVSRTVRITNDSECKVNLLVSASGSFTVGLGSSSIMPGGYVDVTVTFSPGFTRNYNGYLNISPGSASVALSGEGTE